MCLPASALTLTLALSRALAMTLALRLGMTLLLGPRIDVTRLARLALARRTRNLRAVQRQHVEDRKSTRLNSSH